VTRSIIFRVNSSLGIPRSVYAKECEPSAVSPKLLPEGSREVVYKEVANKNLPQDMRHPLSRSLSPKWSSPGYPAEDTWHSPSKVDRNRPYTAGGGRYDSAKKFSVLDSWYEVEVETYVCMVRRKLFRAVVCLRFIDQSESK
jgi:hypothetical protein